MGQRLLAGRDRDRVDGGGDDAGHGQHPDRDLHAPALTKRGGVMRLRGGIGTILRQGLMLVICVVSLYPIWFVIQTAEDKPGLYTLNPTGLPTDPTLHNITTSCSTCPSQMGAQQRRRRPSARSRLDHIRTVRGYAIVAFGSVRGEVRPASEHRVDGGVLRVTLAGPDVRADGEDRPDRDAPVR